MGGWVCGSLVACWLKSVGRRSLGLELRVDSSHAHANIVSFGASQACAVPC